MPKILRKDIKKLVIYLFVFYKMLKGMMFSPVNINQTAARLMTSTIFEHGRSFLFLN